jgi:hypothetical protein
MASATAWAPGYEPSLGAADAGFPGRSPVSTGLLALLSARTTGEEFRQYVVGAGMAAQPAWSEALVQYYAEHGSWAGVDTLLAQLNPGAGMGAMGRGRGSSGTAGPNLGVAQPDGRVVASRSGEMVGEQLPAQLSGGMRKRVGIARAIATNPEIVLYDEPMAGLDPLTVGTINALILKLQRELGVTSVLVTHEIRAGFQVANRVNLLREGEIVFRGTPEEMLASSDSYIRAFLS